ncbi:hypothetical protein [Streptomyces sp. NBC_01264]|uniref:hypothetical protein n=1 Tax=Streptomyces sp. NBC_01264 TaxID=2903804 RepID=UPI002255AE5B|nr:hypothetical protein [Streptomyces sp. NBC_01264]MCX4776134.1 hypothetical protein [Streptomyces sp. NBC_01264]
MPVTTDRTSRNRAASRASRPFTLWREVLTAYAAPALMAGTAGLVNGQRDLAVAACTSIAGTSAVVAFLVGAWLRRGGRPRRWTVTTPRFALTAALVTTTAGAAALLGWFAAPWVPVHIPWVPVHTPVSVNPWLERLRIDLPVSAALATTIVTLRWRAATPALPGSSA